MITAEVIGGAKLDGLVLDRQQSVTVRIRVVHTGLLGAKLKFVAKKPENANDPDDGSAIINKSGIQGGAASGIEIDTSSSNTILVGRMKLAKADTELLNPGETLLWGIQLSSSDGEIPLPELRGTLTIRGDLVKVT